MLGSFFNISASSFVSTLRFFKYLESAGKKLSQGHAYYALWDKGAICWVLRSNSKGADDFGQAPLNSQVLYFPGKKFHLKELSPKHLEVPRDFRYAILGTLALVTWRHKLGNSQLLRHRITDRNVLFNLKDAWKDKVSICFRHFI